MDNLKKKISEVYYNHGLFCATHPVQVIVSVCIIVVILCFPLCQLFIMEDVPLEHMILREDEFQTFENSHMLFSSGNRNKTIGYGIQIVLHASPPPNAPVGCFYLHRSLLETLKNSVKIVQLLLEFQPTSSQTQSYRDICLQIEDRLVTKIGENDAVLNTLPTFGCLLLAPSLLWNNDAEQLEEAYNTLLSRLKKPSMSSLRDLCFGLPWRLTGVRDTAICTPQPLAFVVTTVLREYDSRFISELRHHLTSRFQTNNTSDDSDQLSTPMNDPASDKTASRRLGSHTKHANRVYMVWYRGRSYLSNYAPLILIYIVLLLYVYFSVCKLAMVKSKWGLAFSACFTVVASLCMSIGLCIAIGLMVPTLSGGEIFPYLVVLIGFENVIILTKSVVATPIDLPVKYRIAEGLSKESWPLTKHYFTQLVLLCLGFFTFHPTMQEFCLFAVVGLTTDFFLQLFFFVTVLSVDIRRMELSDLTTLSPNLSVIHDSQDLISTSDEQHQSSDTQVADTPYKTYRTSFRRYTNVNHGFLIPFFRGVWLFAISSLNRVKRGFSHFLSRIMPPFNRSSFHPTHKRRVSAAEAAAFLSSDAKTSENVPRRLRLLRLWANHRLFQRMFIVLVALWITFTVVYTVYLNPYFTRDADSNQSPLIPVDPTAATTDGASVEGGYVASSTSPAQWFGVVDESLASSLKMSTKSSMFRKLDGSGHDIRRINPFFQPTESTWDATVLWNFLAFYQWPLLAKHYNMSLAGHHLVLLEPIHLEYEIPLSAFADDMRPEASSLLFSRHFPYGVREPEMSQLKLDWAWMFSSNCNKEETLIHQDSLSNGKGGGLFREYADELLRIFGKGNPRPVSAVSPGGVAGWTARLWLTVTILGTSFVGCSCVLLFTCLGMIFFQELQTQYSTPSNREPVIRVLPLTISLSEPAECSALEDDDELCAPDWIVSCGKVCHLAEHGATTQIDGVVAVCGIDQNSVCTPTTTSILLWSTTSGSSLPVIQRYSETVECKRQTLPEQARSLVRRRSTVWCMAFLPHGSLLAGCSDGTTELWDCLRNEMLALLLLSSNTDSSGSDQAELKTASRRAATTGGVTTMLVTSDHSVCLGTSRGQVAWFDGVGARRSADAAVEIHYATCQWHRHTRAITQLISMNLNHLIPNIFGKEDSSTAQHFILGSSSEDGSIVFMDPSTGNCLHTLSMDPTAVLSFDFADLLVAVSHASGSMFVSAFRLLISSGELSKRPELSLEMESLDSPIQLAIASKCGQTLSSPASHHAPHPHIGSVGLKVYPSTEALQITKEMCLAPSLSAFRVVTCELDGTLAIWSVKPICLIRTFRLNLSTLCPTNPLVSIDDRVVFGDQGYLRVVNPWTSKYERSVQLLPPSAVSMRNSSILPVLFRRWSKELVPVGVAGSSYNPCPRSHNRNRSPQFASQTSSSNCSSGSVMVSLADCGRTLVIIPLTTLQTTT